MAATTPSKQAQFRKQRLTSLQTAVNEYYTTEKKRLENEVKVLKAILDGRTAGKGIQKSGTATVSKAAQSDLAAYLRGT